MRITLQQLRTTCAVVEGGFNVSRTADALHTTQSAVSKTIKSLEGDLGALIFRRSSTRLVGLTEFGETLIHKARGIVRESVAVMELAQETSKSSRGVLHIGTTHTCARYLLPRAVHAFNKQHPHVVVQIEQGTTKSIPDWVAQGRISIGISVCPEIMTSVVTLLARTIDHCIVAPLQHQILAQHQPSLADLSKFPLITFSEGSTAGRILREALIVAGLSPHIALVAGDATVIKAHVAHGLGIAVLPTIAIESGDEKSLGTVIASHLFAPVDLRLILRREHFLRGYAYDFIEAFASQWTKQAVQEALTS